MKDPATIPAYDPKKKLWQVIIETPKGSHNKFKYDPEIGVFRLNEVLPAGLSFPFDFGYLPSTLGDDGDPVDVMLLMDFPTFCGCMVPSRLIGVIRAEQAEPDGSVGRNDRLLAIADKAVTFGDIQTAADLNKALIDEIKTFFETYTRQRDKTFRFLGLRGPRQAEALVRKGMKHGKWPAKS